MFNFARQERIAHYKTYDDSFRAQALIMRSLVS